MKKLLTAATILVVSTAQADTIFVDDDAQLGGDGLSWSTAFRYLQDALSLASGADITEIRVAQGVYTPDQDEGGNVAPGDREAAFVYPNGVALLGGYAGLGEPDPDARDIALNQTILSGDLLGDDEPGFANSIENSYHVVLADGTDASTVMDGCTVTAGNGDDGSFFSRGAGVHIDGGDIRFINCTFIANQAKSGAAVHNRGGAAPTFTDCHFEGNRADNDAGAMQNAGAESVTLVRCTFVDNVGKDGGVINNLGTTLIATDCHFLSNTSDGGLGSVMFVADATVDLIDCVLAGNSGPDFGIYGAAANLDLTATNCCFANNVGGALRIVVGTLTLTDCTFEGNTNTGRGGAVAIHGEAFGMITGCTFTGNSTPFDRGGAVHVFGGPQGGDTVFDNCHFELNVAQRGGAIDSSGQNTGVVIKNSTFCSNTASQRGGAVLADAASIEVYDSYFFLNDGGAQAGGAIDIDTALVTLERCTFESNTASRGGGVYKDVSASGTMADCLFLKNSSTGTTDGGGGAFLGANLLVTNCDFVGNSATRGGGGVYGWNIELMGCNFHDNTAATRGGGVYHDSPIDYLNCTFIGNSAELTGGGIYIDGPGSLSNCLIADNESAGRGGGVFNEGVSPTLRNCTIIANVSQELGGGFLSQGSSSPSLHNCILWGNSDPTGQTESAQLQDTFGSVTTVTYSCIQALDGFAGSGNIADDPIFIDNDGRLDADSPCIDAGDNDAVAEDVDTDLDGSPRFLEIPETPDTGNGTLPIVDMGAYESLGGGCLAVTSQEIVCHADGTTFTVNIEGLNACTGGTTQVTFTASGGSVGEELCFTALVNDGGFCCTTEICVTIPDCTPAALPSDLDGDGIVGMMDFLALLAAWGPCSDCGTCPADFDGDCSVGILDLLILLGNWG